MLFCITTLLLIPCGVLAQSRVVSISGPAVLDQSDTTYLLTTDITVDDTAFIVAADRVTLDLNGHTVIFGNAYRVDIPNAQFESGSGTVPAAWDLTQAPSARRLPRNFYFGGYELGLTLNGDIQTIRSQAVRVPAQKTFVAYAFVLGPWQGITATLAVHDASENVIARATSQGLGSGGAISATFKLGEARDLHIEITLSGSGQVYLDNVDIKAYSCFGVAISSYHHPAYHNDLPANLPVRGAGTTVRNGTIRQGYGRAAASWGVHMNEVQSITLTRLTVETNGADSGPVWGNFGRNFMLSNSTFRADTSTSYVFNRHDPRGLVTLSQVGGNVTITDNYLYGGMQQGLAFYTTNSAQADSESIIISNNKIENNGFASNGYGIACYGAKNARILNNTIVPITGRGILLDTGTTSDTAIRNVQVSGNTVNAREIPNYEYPARTSRETVAVRLRGWANSGFYNTSITSNIISASAGPTYLATAAGIRVSLQAPHLQGLTLADNKVTVIAESDSDTSYALVFEDVADGTGLLVERNTLQSNRCIVRFGFSDGGSSAGITLRRNNFIRLPGAGAFESVHYGFWNGTEQNNLLIGNSGLNGASQTDIHWDPATHFSNATVSWYLTVLVSDSGGRPVSGAAVTLTDAKGQIVRAISGSAGTAVFEARQYIRSGDGVSGGNARDFFSPYRVLAEAGGLSQTAQVDLAADTTVRLVLGSTPCREPSGLRIIRP
jgi:hypothetical protein